MTAARTRLGPSRWHFRHGPIDVVLEAEGDASVVDAAFDAAWARFTTILDELVAELPALKRALGARCSVDGPIARRMWHACAAHRPGFVTPMAAVAGAVADELVSNFRVPGVRRAWVNNGGDIALHLADGQTADVGLVAVADIARLHRQRGRRDAGIDGRFVIAAASTVRGVATSGWRGRSLSLGIADSVTVLACTAADADAAATMIANAVDVDDATIVRRPASDIVDDSDLGDRLVTVDVPRLRIAAVQRALSAGLRRAEALRRAGIVHACALVLQEVGVVSSAADDSPDSAHRAGEGRARGSVSPGLAAIDRAAWHDPRSSTIGFRVGA